MIQLAKTDQMNSDQMTSTLMTMHNKISATEQDLEESV